MKVMTSRGTMIPSIIKDCEMEKPEGYFTVVTECFFQIVHGGVIMAAITPS